jgi:DnaK suppressor protein
MESGKARSLLKAERARLQELLDDAATTRQEDRIAANEPGDMSDSAEPLTAEGMDDSIAVGLRERLAALDRAEQRLEEGSYGRSVRSGQPIPDDRLEADPAAELTVEEAAAEA